MSRRAVSLFLLALPAVLAGCDEPPAIQEPVPLFDRMPIEYPLALWDAGVEGTTLIRVLVSEVGRVDSVVVMETSGHRAFDSAAVAGASQLRFEPALQDGEVVRVWAEVPVHFTRTAAAEADSAAVRDSGGDDDGPGGGR